MKKVITLSFLFILFLSLGPAAHASSIVLVKDVSAAKDYATTVPKGKAVILTFGEERIFVLGDDQPLPQGLLLAKNIRPEELYLVRDKRRMDRRLGYETLYLHSGFQLARVENPDVLAGEPWVMLQPVTDSVVVVESSEGAAAGDPVIENVLAMLNSSYYEQYLSVLASDLPTRYSCAGDVLTARDIVRNHFQDLGLETSVTPFRNICGGGTCTEPQGFNVIGIKRGLESPDKFYLVGAHYDSTSPQPCQSAPGANDNGSGVAGVMELARVFSQVDTKMSLIFVAFSGEEQGLLGSEKYVSDLIASGNQRNLLGFVVLDMISFYQNNYRVLIEGSNSSHRQKAAIKMLARLGATYTDLEIETSTFYWGSDHEPFLDNGMAGALLIESDWSVYPYYHTAQDNVEYQDILYGLELAKLAAAMLASGGWIIP